MSYYIQKITFFINSIHIILIFSSLIKQSKTMNTKRNLFAIFLLTTTWLVQAGNNQVWVKRYDGPGGFGFDWAKAIVTDKSGNVYVTGGSIGSSYNSDYYTIKYDNGGNVIWAKSYNAVAGMTTSGSADIALAIAVDDSCNVYVTGSSKTTATGKDIATIKYDCNGNQKWVAKYNGSNSTDDEARAIAVDKDGSVYVTGYINHNTSGSAVDDWATIKYDKFGVQQWIQTVGTPSMAEQARALVLDDNANVYVTGYTYALLQGENYTTIKYNKDGVQQWRQDFNGIGSEQHDDAYDIAVDKSGNVYVTGESEEAAGASGPQDYATVKYDKDGVKLWEQRYNYQGGGDHAKKVKVDQNGNVYVTGMSSGIGGFDYATIKYNSGGVQQWVKRYNGDKNMSDYPADMALDTVNNAIYVVGQVGVTSGTDDNFATIKYDLDGNEQWVETYNYSSTSSSSSDWPSAIAIDNQGNAFVTGMSQANGSNYDYVTIKYGGSVATAAPNLDTESESVVYPNPFSNETTIRYNNLKNEKCTLTITDLLGRVVKVITEITTNKIVISGEEMVSGTYFYKIDNLSNGTIQSGKIILSR
jgi:Secretion system C-terminal sorting domain/Beta-propeller repeat